MLFSPRASAWFLAAFHSGSGTRIARPFPVAAMVLLLVLSRYYVRRLSGRDDRHVPHSPARADRSLDGERHVAVATHRLQQVVRVDHPEHRLRDGALPVLSRELLHDRVLDGRNHTNLWHIGCMPRTETR